MTERFNSTITAQAKEFVAKKYAQPDAAIFPVEGGYSRNRRAIIDVGDQSVFVKEVDISVLPGDGEIELGWLRKDYEIVVELSKQGIDIVSDWAELHLDGRLLLMPSYKKEDGWRWSLSEDPARQTDYIQAIVDATKQLEAVTLPEELTKKLSLEPFFRDEIAHYKGVDLLFEDPDLRRRLIDSYTRLQEKGDHLSPIHAQMVETLHSDESLKELQRHTIDLAKLPDNHLNHCDVRSDNIAYNELTGKVKFVDWNWASYAPAKFGATEFLLDMARRGIDVSPWHSDMSVELLAGSVGYYMIRSLKPPLTPGSTLRHMQAETAAVANHLYSKLK